VTSAGAVVVVGDATLDVTVDPRGQLRAGGDTPAIIRLGPGGQGANVAVRLARRGVRVELVAALGPDPAGRLLGEWLAHEGVALTPIVVQRSGVVLSLLDADGERSMLSDRSPFDGDARPAIARASAVARWVHCSGYLLRGEDAAELAGEVRRAAGALPLSVAGGSVPAGTPARRFGVALRALQPDLLALAGDEAAALAGGRASAEEMVTALVGFAPVTVVTAGAAGSAIAAGGVVHSVPPTPDERPVIDATGAGDAYVAALIAAFASSRWPPDERTLLAAASEAARAGGQAARVHGAQGPIDGERAVVRS